jgi:hypothetical protein
LLCGGHRERENPPTLQSLQAVDDLVEAFGGVETPRGSWKIGVEHRVRRIGQSLGRG